jgi:HAD superfamily PSPase-like hydrolase
MESALSDFAGLEVGTTLGALPLQYKLVCFDLDGTLIDDTIYIWQTLHEAFGVPKDERQQHHSDYMAGRISYAEWFATDIAAWRRLGKSREDIVAVVQDLSVMNGAIATLEALKAHGHRLAVISGSIDIVIDTLLGRDFFDDVFINRLHFDTAGAIIGGEPTPYDMEHKATGLQAIADRKNLDISECAFVGDNENDVHIAELAGFSISFNSKSRKLDSICDVVIDNKDLRDILPHLEV